MTGRSEPAQVDAGPVVSRAAARLTTPAGTMPLTMPGLAALLLALLVFQFGDLARLPLEVWDESRLAVNAIEMLMTGNRLATSFGFVPDLWNTKPPLLINLQAAAMALLGPTPFALRLPSALAACATVVLVAAFVRRVTGSLGAGVAAGVLLATAPVFYGYHAGRTADYDALLTLLTTLYGAMLFTLIESDRARPGLAAATGVVVGLAVLTKGIAGVVPGVGIAVFALVFAAPRLVRHALDYAIVAAGAAVIGGGYYLLRAGGGDGYLAAVAANDLGGRFSGALDGHVGGPLLYVRDLLRRPPGMLLPLALAVPLLARGPATRLALFAAAQVAGMLAVYSSAATKLSWYIVPTLPFVAILVALGGFALVRRAGRSSPGAARIAIGIAALGLVVLMANAVRVRYFSAWVLATPSRAFGTLIDTAAARGLEPPLVVVDTGYANQAGFTDYAPTLRFYALAAARRGVRVDHAVSLAAVPAAARTLGACDPATVDAVAAAGRTVWRGAGCVLVAR